jgi:hypothetical protein
VGATGLARALPLLARVVRRDGGGRLAEAGEDVNVVSTPYEKLEPTKKHVSSGATRRSSPAL